MAISQEMCVHYNYDTQVLEIIPSDSDRGICIPASEIVKSGFNRCQEPFADISDLEEELETSAYEAYTYRGWSKVHRSTQGDVVIWP